MEISPHQQILYFLRSFAYTWIFASPRRDLISASADDPTHFKHKIHITRGWSGSTVPLCGAFTASDYEVRRLWAPAMDERNLCVSCRTKLQQEASQTIARCTDVVLLTGRMERRGDTTMEHMQMALTVLSKYVETAAMMEAQRVQALRSTYEELQQLGMPLQLPDVLQLPALPAPAESAQPMMFVNNETSYIKWRNQHADGFIANVTPQRVVLHRADCDDLAGEWESGASWTEGSSQKIGCPDLAQLQVAVKHIHRPGNMTMCTKCRPE